MRVPVNLSSEPFRRDRPLIVASAVVSGLLVALLVLLTSVAIAERNRSAAARQTAGRLDSELRDIAARSARIENVLRESQNAEVLDKAQFINGLLLHKSVSWTRMFADLEKVVPHNVRLISIHPQVNAQNNVTLDMVVGAQASESVLNFIMQLEAAQEFGATTPHGWLAPTQNEPLYRYRVTVQYVQTL